MDFAEQTFHQTNPRQHKNSPGGASRGCQQQMSTLSSHDVKQEFSSCFASVVCKLDCLRSEDTSVSHGWVDWRFSSIDKYTNMFITMLAWMSWITAPQGTLRLVCVHVSNNAKKVFLLSITLIEFSTNARRQGKKRCLKHNNRDTRTVGEKWGVTSGYWRKWCIIVWVQGLGLKDLWCRP